MLPNDDDATDEECSKGKARLGNGDDNRHPDDFSHWYRSLRRLISEAKV
jgi:hypothetical protein